MANSRDAIETFLAAIAEPAQSALRRLRAQIEAAAPGAEQVINYGVPMFRLDGRNHRVATVPEGELLAGFQIEDADRDRQDCEERCGDEEAQEAEADGEHELPEEERGGWDVDGAPFDERDRDGRL